MIGAGWLLWAFPVVTISVGVGVTVWWLADSVYRLVRRVIDG